MKGTLIENFVVGSDKDYDQIREMHVWLAKQGKQP
jgi:hypothetical protein